VIGRGMVSTRRHLEALLASEKERVNLLVAVCLVFTGYLFREIERRQRLRESEDKTRRMWVDSQLALSRESELGHRERQASFSRAVKVAVGAATLIATVLVAYGTLLAVHAI
jgi:hypothetical protein